MYEIKDLQRTFGLTWRQINLRLDALLHLLDGHLQRGKNNRKLLDGYGFELFKRLLELERLKEELERLKGELDEARERFQGIRERPRTLEKELSRLQSQRAHLEMLRPLRIDIGALRRLERFVIVPGMLPRENLDQLELSLQEMPHALLPYRLEHRRVQLVAVVLKEDEEELSKILEAALFQPLELPELSGLPEEALKQLDQREQELKEQLAQVERELAEFERWRAERRVELGDLLKINHATLAALEQTGQTREVSVAVGWVPRRKLKELERIVREEPHWILQSEELPYRSLRDEYGLQVPSKLRNPPFFRAFEGLINVYGAPRYGGFDPTIIFAFLFILLFGMMFGDLGQGLVLLLFGLGLRFWPGFGKPGLRRTGTVLAAVGFSSMVFGTLYGSFFGYDNIIPALWFRPMEEIDRLLVYAVIVGIGAILIGIFVNIASKLLQGRYAELIFERSGILGLWFYLGALLVVWTVIKGGTLSLPLIFVLMFLPLLLMPLEKPFARRLQREAEHEEEREGLFAQVVTAAVDVFETMIVYLSNSISFVRVAAFALNHVALSLAIFQLGGMLRTFPLGGVLYILIVAVGNLIILVLEGGIVAIQTLRLGFYEFFSKFFQEEGTEFRPFKFEFVERR
ncbi:MAG: V-type ATP synthase subunit I [Candidatus Bipolaricaulia bacterium]